MKVAIQWNEKDFQQSLKSRSDCPFFNDLFWKLQFNENEKNFQLSFCLCFHIFSESRNSTKMKRTFNCNFDFVFTAQARLALLSIFFESRNSMKMKRTFSCDFGLISKQKQSIPFADPFWKLQFNEVQRTFHFHFYFISHKVLLNDSVTSKTCLLNFWLFTLKVKCSRSLREVLHGVGLPLPTLLQSTCHMTMFNILGRLSKIISLLSKNH